jgi:dipeptidyl aminopeptidase/acylaminoacyl peptidase
MVVHAPYGSWPSPIPAELLVAGAARPTDVAAEGGITWWSQSRPSEGGREQLVRRDPDGSLHDLLPDGWSARTRAHEYGGAAWWVAGGVVFFACWADQRLYRIDPGAGRPEPITPEPAAPQALRYADGRVTPDGAFVVCVRESHPAAGDVGDDPGQVRNEIVAVSSSGGEPTVLVSGPDFVAAPRISPDGSRLAWLSWDHPDMPWDGTRLWVADLVPDGAGGLAASGAELLAGGRDESLVQPEWGPDGTLYVVSDRSDWWNVYEVLCAGPGTGTGPAAGTSPAQLRPVCPVEAEVGLPAWVFGQSRYLPAAGGVVWFTFSDGAGAHLVEVAADGSCVDRPIDCLGLQQLRLDVDRLVAIASEAEREPSVVAFSLPGAGSPPGAELVAQVLQPPRDLALPAGALSRGRRIDFPSEGGREAHAWFYPPAGEGVNGPHGELPPLLVMVHGGPTAAADPSFRLSTQFWTSRGFAVVDVDYGGSTGYGRPYRRLLDGGWGIVDVQDACAAARWLAEQGLVDGARLAIRGGSAGGFTTLAALAGTDVFAAGASHYGVADLGALARDTHKFEARYLDGLVGPWPQAEAVYTERSPLSRLEGFTSPLIVLQGLQDEVVPPAQAELIVAGLRERGVPHAYLAFEGEQHGFRIAANIVRAITAELYFYSRVFGFTADGAIEPVEIAFADRLTARPGADSG